MALNDSVRAGWDFATSISTSGASAMVGDMYVTNVANAIDALQDAINSYAGDKTPISILKGFMSEEWHTGTFNINAALRGVKNYAVRENSNAHASSDITVHNIDGTQIEYSLKWYATGAKSANAQAKTIIDAYHEYCYKSRTGEPMSFEQYLDKNGYGQDADIYMSVYTGQGRIIPSDQLQEAINYLHRKIQEESQATSSSRIAITQSRLETLQRLNDRIQDGNGTESIKLSKEEARVISALAKEGEFDAENFGISIEMITNQYILQQALKAGITASVISLVLQLAPEIYKTIDYLIKNGEIDTEQLKKSGTKAITASATGFIRGSVACALTIACQSGKLGQAFIHANPTIIGAVTVLVMNTFVHSYKVACGSMSARQMGVALTKEIIVSAASIPSGIIGQALLPQLPVLGYMLGSLLGSTIAGIGVEIGEKILLSFCVDSGFTCFGLVEQDYTLPVETLERMGLRLIDIPQKNIPRKNFGKKNIPTKKIQHKKYETIDIVMVKRGIIGINKIGYV